MGSNVVSEAREHRAKGKIGPEGIRAVPTVSRVLLADAYRPG
jgi:hypothetical protein